MATAKQPDPVDVDAVDAESEEPRTGRATKVPGPNSTFAERAKAAGRNRRIASGDKK